MQAYIFKDGNNITNKLNITREEEYSFYTFDRKRFCFDYCHIIIAGQLVRMRASFNDYYHPDFVSSVRVSVHIKQRRETTIQ